ncbi:unnamed protein product [Litomosoides sigmodontis]|uniref:Uncharacterized protein n=1 Tax=Litomosoides sigmodontis TaxID=42156 RepID=A0A3P7M615_LITSI|nr:unnamed protein product [Litomosoides sigmodontis]
MNIAVVKQCGVNFMTYINPISILRGRVNDEHDDADNDGDVDDARGRIRDDRDDDNDAMGCSSRRPTSRTLSLISPKQPATTLQ